MVTMSDTAYTVAVIENSYEAWDEEQGIDNAGEGEEQDVYQRPQKKGQDEIHQPSGEEETVQHVGVE